MPTAEETLAQIQRLAQSKPVAYVRGYIGSDPWSIQEEIIESVWNYRTTAVKSCHGIGKSWTGAHIVATFLQAFPGAKVITTAPTARQVREILWREINNVNAKSKTPLAGECKVQSWEIAPDWFALGLSTDEPDKFQGYHADFYLVVVDEAAGVGEPIFEAIEGTLTSLHSKLLMIGNPTNLSGKFYNAFRDPSVNKITISCFDTPNFTANGITNVEELRAAGEEDFVNVKIVKPHLITPQWAYEKLVAWGEDSPMFQARVLGEFPRQGDDTLIPLAWIEAAANEDHYAKVEEGAPVHSLDPARYGSDKSAFGFRKGHSVKPFETTSKQDTMATAGKAVDRVMERPGDLMIEAIGIGGPIYDRIAEEEIRKRFNEKGVDVYQVTVSGSPTDKEMFVNLRDELFWILRDLFQPKKQKDGTVRPTIAIPKDEELMAQLAALRFKYTSRGQIKVEKKEEMKKRIGQSPDKADALAVSYARKNRGSVDDISLGPESESVFRGQDDLIDEDQDDWDDED